MPGDDNGSVDESAMEMDESDMGYSSKPTNEEANHILQDGTEHDTYNAGRLSKIQEHPALQMLATVVLPMLLRLANPTPASFVGPINPGIHVSRRIADSLSTVHVRAVECLNNFLLAMVDVVEGKWWFTNHKQDAEQLWTWLFELINSLSDQGLEDITSNPCALSMVEAIVGCLWSTARGLDRNVVSSCARMCLL